MTQLLPKKQADILVIIIHVQVGKLGYQTFCLKLCSKFLSNLTF